MKENLKFKILAKENTVEIATLYQQQNTKYSIEELVQHLHEMFAYDNYHCFGLFHSDTLIGISSGWGSVRFYSGKQLEVDNVIIDLNYQSNGFGKFFFEQIENWAKENDCKTIELNTYTKNARAHKFYLNLGYSILAFHFQKQLE